MTTKRDARGRLRNYTKEYKRDHSSPTDIKRRDMRNEARAQAGCGKGMEADHKQPLSKGGSNRRSNIRCISRHMNRVKGAKVR